MISAVSWGAFRNNVFILDPAGRGEKPDERRWKRKERTDAAWGRRRTPGEESGARILTVSASLCRFPGWLKVSWGASGISGGHPLGLPFFFLELAQKKGRGKVKGNSSSRVRWTINTPGSIFHKGALQCPRGCHVPEGKRVHTDRDHFRTRGSGHSRRRGPPEDTIHLQEEARIKAATAAVSEAQARINLAFAQYLLNHGEL